MKKLKILVITIVVLLIACTSSSEQKMQTVTVTAPSGAMITFTAPEFIDQDVNLHNGASFSIKGTVKNGPANGVAEFLQIHMSTLCHFTKSIPFHVPLDANGNADFDSLFWFGSEKGCSFEFEISLAENFIEKDGAYLITSDKEQAHLNMAIEKK